MLKHFYSKISNFIQKIRKAYLKSMTMGRVVRNGCGFKCWLVGFGSEFEH